MFLFGFGGITLGAFRILGGDFEAVLQGDNQAADFLERGQGFLARGLVEIAQATGEGDLGHQLGIAALCFAVAIGHAEFVVATTGGGNAGSHAEGGSAHLLSEALMLARREIFGCGIEALGEGHGFLPGRQFLIIPRSGNAGGA